MNETPSDKDNPSIDSRNPDDASRSGDDGEFSLTDEQQRALDLDRNVAITAGAGTGKTTTLTQRYRAILEADPTIEPTNIITITFTRNAAAEMRDRIREVVDKELAGADRDEYDRWRRAKDEVDDAYVHTIHGFCSRILREFSVEANLHPDFETLDEMDAKTIVRDVSRDVLMAASSESPTSDSLSVSDRRVEAAADDVNRLAELFSRSKLTSLLCGLVSERPDSDEWADAILEESKSAYIEEIVVRECPIGSEEADTLTERQDVRKALNTIAALAEQEFQFAAEEDAGRENLNRISALLPAETTVDRQLLLFEICDIVTSGGGSVYSQSHYYAGSATRWQKHGREEENETLVAAFGTLIDALDPESRNLEANLAAAATSAPYVFALARLYRVIRDEYEARKDDRNGLDYSDLIERTVEFLETDDQARRELREQFEYVMVDEVQDTDPRQWDLVQLLTGSDSPQFDGENVFLVGDEKQSIYRFRRADVTMFRRARDLLNSANPPGSDADEQLSGNFRTLPDTLSFVNDLFDRVFEPEDEDEGHRPYEAQPQRLTAERSKGVDIEGTVEYLVTPEGERGISELGLDGSWFDEQTFESSAEREAATVAARLTRLFDDPPTVYDEEASEYRPAMPSDIALLFRTKTRLRPFERALEKHDIPYTSVGGQSLYDTAEVTPLVNLLKVVQNPERDIPLYGVLRSALFGFTDDELAALYGPETCLWEELNAADSQLSKAANRIAEWRSTCGTDGSEQIVKWGALVSRIIDETGYLVGIGADERPRQAVVNVNQFRESLRTWEEGGALPISDVLSRIERERTFDSDAGEAEIPTGAKGVQLRTVHSAKGLEFPIVLIPELGRTAGDFATITYDEGKYPQDLAYLEEVDGEPVLGIRGPDPDDPLETMRTPDWNLAEYTQEREERAEVKRVLYVAATRVRDHLLLSGTHEFDEEVESTFGSFGSGEDADRWRDWVQPVLLEDRNLLSDLRSEGTAQRDLPGSTYTVSRPPEPVAGLGVEGREERDYDIEVSAPTVSPTKADVSATDFRELVAETAEAGMSDGEQERTTKDAEPFLGDLERRSSLDPQAFGTIVHRLCELSLTGIGIDWDVHPSRVVDTPACLTPEEISRVRDHVNVGVCQVRELERTIDVRRTLDELQVALSLDAGRIVGDIDHLTVTDDRYYVTDYKTDSLASREVDELAKHYWPQLRVYACALQEASPKKAVVLRLVFTDGDEVRTETLREGDIDRYRAEYNEVLEDT